VEGWFNQLRIQTHRRAVGFGLCMTRAAQTMGIASQMMANSFIFVPTIPVMVWHRAQRLLARGFGRYVYTVCLVMSLGVVRNA